MLHNSSDTICAISTPPGQGGIAVIRVSGADAFSICNKIIKSGWGQAPPLQAKTLTFGSIFRGDEILDEVLVSTFKNPFSYTGEDTVEISCHGSLYIQREIIKLLLANGCRLATAGEFTQRAFLNGKIDLSQAEAVGDLIASTSATAHRIAMMQMRGGISNELSALSDKLLHFTSLVELELDFADEDVEFADRSQLKGLALQVETAINRLVDSFEAGNAIKNGIPVAIAGETNAGKSTLLNRLLKEERAIVSDIHGTTRDAIEDTVDIDGLMFRFIDTAGIRETFDAIEQLGIERSFQKIEQASIVLWVIDLTNDTLEPKQIIERTKGKKLIFILNKADLLNNEERNRKTAYYSQFNEDYIVISAKSDPTPRDRLISPQITQINAETRVYAADYQQYNLCKSAKICGQSTYETAPVEYSNITALERKLVETANIPQIGENDVVVANMRHYEALTNALAAIQRVVQGLDACISGDLISLDIRECLFHLGQITGKQISTEDVLGNIFSRFCIGK